MTTSTSAAAAKHAPYAYLIKALGVARGDPSAAAAYLAGQPHLLAQRPAMAYIDIIEKAAVDPRVASEFPRSEAGSSFLAAVRQRSVAGQFRGLRQVPHGVRLYFAERSGALLAAVPEGAPIPVITGVFTETTLTPIKVAAIDVVSLELARHGAPIAAEAVSSGLVAAMARSENATFIAPHVTGSLLNTATSFTAAGASVAQIDTTLLDLVDAVPAVGDGAASWIMSASTAARLATKRGTGGETAYPDIGIEGGELLGLPVIICDEIDDEAASPLVRHIGLVAGSEIFFASDDGVQIDVSQEAALQLDTDPASGAQALVSLFSANLFATRAIMQVAWHARGNAAAYAVMTGL
jgi:hypothetical protein